MLGRSKLLNRKYKNKIPSSLSCWSDDTVFLIFVNRPMPRIVSIPLKCSPLLLSRRCRNKNFSTTDRTENNFKRFATTASRRVLDEFNYQSRNGQGIRVRITKCSFTKRNLFNNWHFTELFDYESNRTVFCSNCFFKNIREADRLVKN